MAEFGRRAWSPPMGSALELEAWGWDASLPLSSGPCEIAGSLIGVVLHWRAKVAQLRSGCTTYCRPAAVRCELVEQFLLLSDKVGELIVGEADLAVGLKSFKCINVR